MVALHGCTQTAIDFAAGTQFDTVAESAGAYVLYPEQSVANNSNRCWNWFEPEHQRRDAGEPAAILALVSETLAGHPIDPRAVFVVGLSSGGAMAAILAEQAPDVFAGVGIMAGVPLHASHDLRSANAAMRGDVQAALLLPLLPRDPGRAARFGRMRASVWTGALDRTVDPANASVLAQQFLDLFDVPDVAAEHERRADCDVTRWRDAAGDVRVETWTVRAMGHSWSGGSFRGSHTFPRGPQASDVMLRFFLDERPAPR